jgi:hypothetical protein
MRRTYAQPPRGTGRRAISLVPPRRPVVAEILCPDTSQRFGAICAKRPVLALPRQPSARLQAMSVAFSALARSWAAASAFGWPAHDRVIGRQMPFRRMPSDVPNIPQNSVGDPLRLFGLVTPMH